MKKYFALAVAFLFVMMMPINVLHAETTSNAAPTKKVEKKEAKYVASSSSKTYHLPSCKLAQNIKPENLVKFPTKAAAKKAGYSPCSVCLK